MQRQEAVVAQRQETVAAPTQEATLSVAEENGLEVVTPLAEAREVKEKRLVLLGHSTRRLCSSRTPRNPRRKPRR